MKKLLWLAILLPMFVSANEGDRTMMQAYWDLNCPAFNLHCNLVREGLEQNDRIEVLESQAVDFEARLAVLEGTGIPTTNPASCAVLEVPPTWTETTVLNIDNGTQINRADITAFWAPSDFGIGILWVQGPGLSDPGIAVTSVGADPAEDMRQCARDLHAAGFFGSADFYLDGVLQ